MELGKGGAGLKEDLTVENSIFSEAAQETPVVYVASAENLNSKEDIGENSDKETLETGYLGQIGAKATSSPDVLSVPQSRSE